METPKGFQLSGCEPYCLALAMFLYPYPESWQWWGQKIHPGYEQGLDSRPKGINLLSNITGLQLIYQGIQEVSNIALDTQVGLQKTSLFNIYLLNTYGMPGTILGVGNIQVKSKKKKDKICPSVLKFTF